MTEMASIIDELVASAKAEDWNKVDSELVSRLKDSEGNNVAIKLLEIIGDPNPDVRDVIATSLTVLIITDRGVFTKAVQAMINMAGTDQEKFPAGRAAVFLLSHQGDKLLKKKIDEGIEKFKMRPEIPDWKKDLTDNIPRLEEILK